MQIHGIVRRLRSAFVGDDTLKTPRLSSFGDQYALNILNPGFGLVDEGAIFSAINPTPGTGIAQTIQASFLATNALLTFRNNSSSANKRMYPLVLRLQNTVVGTSTTRTEMLISVDNVTRYSSGGTAITALQNRNMDDSQVSEGVLHFGALTLLAESAAVRRVTRGVLRVGIMVQFEEFKIQFGGEDSDPQTIGGTTALRTINNVPPVCLGLGDSMQVHVWNVGNVTTAPSWEFEYSWIERG